ncbi:opioid-binding protein/cell adhesion molecule homolog [Plodia interpunctella]|uniref:opioid-binding protein/cell adhesion molecule homolog n=1 Tax=Plodia interpunctella TaxID=58824 RepID=UPI0023683C7D|nr:opioid-binding protein/cell adhesion molecule homolog [Plodia interpunctella]XP_053603987.1 opioid-binding protein/cell adhesion molecule homolog [Plodia interpunctella]XP_053603988.1 opioid-binding protein/cell adhesion molecule homolog [Plodia interpunctella]XP_053603989.1 opioid-binding protein/cell adhesion molecule homolog [Plodia interpunctella]XP_053603990.1 opioid-binding protein/cell adhesion molecule homolog [Plodia interpunctella]XP_053603991.1 opioid-binding protein/cell adhesio
MHFLSRINLIKSGNLLLAIIVLDWLFAGSTDATIHEPGFTGPIANVTAPLGREAVLACTVHNLSTFKVAWLRVDTQTILTIHNHVISRSRRVGVTHSDQRVWFLHIRELRETDRGWYMCQINTDPMKSQLGYLDVVVPPDILDRGTSTDQTVREGASVSLTCAASGSPSPQIVWRREHSKPITIADGIQVSSLEGHVLNISRVSRQHAGAYLCIASNGVPPTVSKRIMLTVQFPPVITIRNQLVGAALGTDLVLECETEAYPKPVSYWSRENGEIVPVGGGLEPQKVEGSYRSVLRLAIRRITTSDYGAYKCVSKNSLGDTEGTIKLYPMPPAALENKNVVQRLNIMADKASESTPFGTQDFRLQDFNTAVSRNRLSSSFLLTLVILVETAIS